MILNTRDEKGLVHVVRDRPGDLKNGRTACFQFFTWPLYAAHGRDVWNATRDMVTCLACITCL